MLVTIIPLLVAIIGVLMFFVSTNPKVQKVGEIMFWTGLLVTLFATGSQTVKLP